MTWKEFVSVRKGGKNMEEFGGIMNNALVPVCIKVKGERDSVSDNQFYV